MTTITGGCLCGRVRYEYRGHVGPASYCHCADCRRCTGSAFNIGVRLEAAHFRISGNDVRSFTKRGDSGNELTRHFCGDCGSPLYTSSSRHPEHVYVKAGTLDDPSLVQPQTQSWTASAVAWARIDEALPRFTKGRT